MNSRLLGAVCACVSILITTTTTAALLPLESRLGGLAYYDPNLNITWAADANINGSDTWDNQVAWAAGLTIGGVSGWRLPSANVNGDNTVMDCFGGGVVGCADNEKWGTCSGKKASRLPHPVRSATTWTGSGGPVRRYRPHLD